MAKSSFSRREFLKISALSSSAFAVGGCTSFNQYFMGDKRDLSDEVIILGAGAAGLAAGFALKKKKIPYRVFEASSRLGGRVQTVPIFPEGGPVAELGAEFFEEAHQSIFNLAKELNLNVNEIKGSKGQEAHLFHFSGRTYHVKDLQAKLKTLSGPLRRVREDLFREQDVILTYKNAQQFERSAYYDSLSLAELLQSWSREVDPLILKLIEVQAVERWGADASDLSSIHFLQTLDAEGSSLLAGRSTYRMEGGLTRLTSTLYGRVAGVIPSYFVKMRHVLTEISEHKGVFTLTFQTEQGKEVYRARNIICTLPFSKLKEVKGLLDLQFSALKKQVIFEQAYATHTKGALAFDNPFWRKKGTQPANLGNFTGDFLTQKIWDSGRTQEGLQGLLTFQRGGSGGATAGAEAATQAISDLEIFYPGLDEKKWRDSQVINWSQMPWSRGSMAYFKKDQYMRFKGVAGEADYNGRFLFAGEHTSIKFAGTLHGALQSGLDAAAKLSI